jgi:hypothetical protein
MARTLSALRTGHPLLPRNIFTASDFHFCCTSGNSVRYMILWAACTVVPFMPDYVCTTTRYDTPTRPARNRLFTSLLAAAPRSVYLNIASCLTGQRGQLLPSHISSFFLLNLLQKFSTAHKDKNLMLILQWQVRSAHSAKLLFAN